jgi:cathepsin B
VAHVVAVPADPNYQPAASPDDFVQERDVSSAPAISTVHGNPETGEAEGFATKMNVGDHEVILASNRALTLMNEMRKNCDEEAFDDRSPTVSAAYVHVAQGAEYTLTMTLGQKMYTVTVIKDVPADVHPQLSGLDARFRLLQVSPALCKGAQYKHPELPTDAELDAINEAADRPGARWRATSYDFLKKESLASAKAKLTGLNLNLMPTGEFVQQTVVAKQNVDNKYDFRTAFPYCKAHKPKMQGSCGACFAFASATALSARLCAAAGKNADLSRYNVDLSPQKLLSCGSGDCSGGHMMSIYRDFATPMGKTVPHDAMMGNAQAGGHHCVSDWCRPYLGMDATTDKGTCTAADECSNSLDFSVDVDSISWQNTWWNGEDWSKPGDADARVTAMMHEIQKNGPTAAAMVVHEDFYNYKDGVYRVTKESGSPGGHAVVLMGWGEDDDGTKYWLAQNSWGEGWGEEGFFRIRRGTNEANIEMYGSMIADMHMPKQCKDSKICQNGGEFFSDCKCRCEAPWTGDDCTKCHLACDKNNTASSSGCKCTCKPGSFDPLCGSTTVVVGDETPAEQSVGVTVNLFLGPKANVKAGDMLMIVPEGMETYQNGQWTAVAQKYVCLSEEDYPKTCDYAESVKMDLPRDDLSPKAATYQLYITPYLGTNEFGVSNGWSPHHATKTQLLIKVTAEGTVSVSNTAPSLKDANLDGHASVAYLDDTGKAFPTTQCIALSQDGTKSSMETRQTSGNTTAAYTTEITWHIDKVATKDKPGHGTRTFRAYNNLQVRGDRLFAIDRVANDLDESVSKHQSFAYRYLDKIHDKYEVVVSNGWQETPPTPPTEFKTINGKQMLARFTKGQCTEAKPLLGCEDISDPLDSCAEAKADNFKRKHQLCGEARFHAKCEQTCGVCGADSNKCMPASTKPQCSGHGTCVAGGLYGTCKCANGYRTASCSKRCPTADNGKICSGNGSCNSSGECECFGSYAGIACEVADRVIDLQLLEEKTEDATKLSSSDHQIPSILGSATHVPASRFKLLDAASASYGRVVRVQIGANAEADSNVTLFVEEQAQRSAFAPDDSDLGDILLETEARDHGAQPSADRLAAELQTMAEQPNTTLKTGPLASLKQITVEPLSACSPDKFVKCADGTCMPKGTVTIASNGQCCTYDDASGTSTHCPPNAHNSHLNLCSAVKGSFSKKFTCKAPSACSSIESFFGICSGGEALGTNAVLIAALAIAALGAQR